MHRSIQRVVWAIDPLECDLSVDLATVREIGEWTKRRSIKVEPVYVFTPVRDRERLAINKIRERVRFCLSPFQMEALETTLLANPTDSVSQAGLAFLEHAERTDAGLIMVSSHGRVGQPRMLFGSFAEFLLNNSTLPILFLNHHRRPAGASIQNALWATAFTRQCGESFDYFLSASNGVCRKVALFHDTSLSVEMQNFFWDFRPPVSDELLEMQKSIAREHAREWIDRANRKGLLVTPGMEVFSSESAGDILSATHQSRAGMIIMTAQAGPFTHVVFGSWARQVFRANEYPVWVYGPRCPEAAKTAQPTSPQLMESFLL